MNVFPEPAVHGITAVFPRFFSSAGRFTDKFLFLPKIFV
jgi:hypothetical protein